MSSVPEKAAVDRDTVFNDIVEILKTMTADWDTSFDGQIGPETALIGDLDFESIDVVQLVVAIEEKYQRRDLPFDQLLMEEGRYVDELKVGRIVDFMAEHLNAG